MHLPGALSYAIPNLTKSYTVTYNIVSYYFDDCVLSNCIKREISLFYNKYFGELSAKVQETPLSISKTLCVLAKLDQDTHFNNSRFGFFIITSPDL